MSSSDTADDGSHNESARSKRSQDKGWGPRHAAEASSGVDISIPYSNPPTDRLMAFYAECAERYDTDLIDTYSYMAPSDAVAGLMQLNLPQDAAILDAGHGTAQAGKPLAAAEYSCVNGADLPAEMHSVGARQNVYCDLFELDVTVPFGPQVAARNGGAHYNAVICFGVFGFGPPHVNDLPRIMDATRPGAPVLVNGKGWDLRGHAAQHNMVG